MRLRVPIHRIYDEGRVADNETLQVVVEDPKGRDDLMVEEAWTLYGDIRNGTRSMGPGISLVDPYVEDGCLIVRVEIRRTDQLVGDAVAAVQRVVLDAFGRL